jgi:hypothetical protein
VLSHSMPPSTCQERCVWSSRLLLKISSSSETTTLQPVQKKPDTKSDWTVKTETGYPKRKKPPRLWQQRHGERERERELWKILKTNLYCSLCQKNSSDAGCGTWQIEVQKKTSRASEHT